MVTVTSQNESRTNDLSLTRQKASIGAFSPVSKIPPSNRTTGCARKNTLSQEVLVFPSRFFSAEMSQIFCWWQTKGKYVCTLVILKLLQSHFPKFSFFIVDKEVWLCYLWSQPWKLSRRMQHDSEVLSQVQLAIFSIQEKNDRPKLYFEGKSIQVPQLSAFDCSYWLMNLRPKFVELHGLKGPKVWKTYSWKT